MRRAPGWRRAQVEFFKFVRDCKLQDPKRLPSIYIHDPGERFNVRAMADPRQGWNSTNHHMSVELI